MHYTVIVIRHPETGENAWVIFMKIAFHPCRRTYKLHCIFTVFTQPHNNTILYVVLVEILIFLLCNQQRWRSDVKSLAKARICCLVKPGNISHVMSMNDWMNGNSGPNCIQNLFHNTSRFLERPLLLYIIMTGGWAVNWIFCVLFLHRDLVHFYYVFYV